MENDIILEKVKPLMDGVFNRYSFLNIQEKQRIEIIKKIIDNINHSGNELRIDYLKKMLILYLDNYVKKCIFDKYKTVVLLNRYINSLTGVNNYCEAISALDKLKIFMDKYNYILEKEVLRKLMNFSEKFLMIANFCIKEYENIENNNYIIDLIIELYFEKINSEMKNNNHEYKNAYDIYLNEVTKIPLLTDENEKRLFHEYWNGDLKARDMIAESNLRIVISVAIKYIKCGLSFEDLIQEGNLGLVTAIEHYEDNRNCKFSTYAYYWIRRYITRAIKGKSRDIRLPEYIFGQITKYKNAKRELEDKLGRSSTLEEVSEYMNISYENAMILYYAQIVPSSMNLLLEEDGDELGDFIVSETPKPEDLAVEYDMKRRVYELLENSNLKEKEKAVIKTRFGFDDGKYKTLEETGKIHGVTRERVRQIEKKVLEKLRRVKNIECYRSYISDDDAVKGR